MFVAASLVTRGARFFAVAAIVRRFGPAILPVIERRLALAAAVLIALLVGGVLTVRFLG
jgi:hypothetical protein